MLLNQLNSLDVFKPSMKSYTIQK